jgi:ATP-binding cassette subfamily B protein/subfamily B ATP-binding cassette protein MsbA
MKPVASDRSPRREARRRRVGGSEASAAGGKRREYIREYLRWLKPHRYGVAILFVLALIGTGLQMIEPLFMRFIIDRVLLNTALDTATRLNRLNLAGFTFLSVIILASCVGILRDYRQRLLNTQLMLALRRSLFDQLLHLPLPKLWDMKTGGILSRLTGDVDTPAAAAGRHRLAVGLIHPLVHRDWRAADAQLAAGDHGDDGDSGAMLISFVFARRVRPIYRAVRKDVERSTAASARPSRASASCRAFGRENARAARVHARPAHVLRKELFAQRRELFCGAVGATGLGRQRRHHLVRRLSEHHGRRIDRRHHGLSVVHVPAPQSGLEHRQFVLGAAAIACRDGAGVRGAGDAGRQTRSARCTAGPTRRRRDRAGACRVRIPRGPASGPRLQRHRAGRFRRRARGTKRRRQDDGDRPRGAFHDPSEGRIVVNGTDIRDFKLASYRSLLAIVQQDVFLFDGSARDNIAYGRHNASAAEIEDAARRANAHEFIEKLPEGYDTFVGERGVKLSGGQQQRLAIARAILANPQILILDEATSNLDTESEQLIQASMAELLAGRTTFVIAHRLSTVRRANLILLMEDGRIVERGTHEELMAARGMYYEMVLRQAESAGESVEAVLR